MSIRTILTNGVLVISLLFNIQLNNQIMFSSTADMWSTFSATATASSVDAPSGQELMLQRNPNMMSNASIIEGLLLDITSTNSTTQATASNATWIFLDNHGQPKVVNLMFGMSGARLTFIDEWEISLKSILLNAPVDAPLHIHIVANTVARKAVQERILAANIVGKTTTKWRQPITITIYEVGAEMANQWGVFIREKIRGHRMDRRVTLGGYYRLLAHKILPPGTGPVLYMDTDSVITTNLNDLWKLVDYNKIIQLSLAWVCSGFMVLNMDKLEQFWEGIDNLENITHGGDQTLVADFVETYPDKIGDLPSSWDANLGNGWKHTSHWFLRRRPEGVGFLHFNGYRPNNEAYYTKGFMQYCTGGCKRRKKSRAEFQRSWALADYYVRITWPWVAYFGLSRIGLGKEGHALKFKVLEVGETTPVEPYPETSRQSKESSIGWEKKVAKLKDQFAYEELQPMKIE